MKIKVKSCFLPQMAFMLTVGLLFTNSVAYITNQGSYIALQAPPFYKGLGRYGAKITVKTTTPELILLQAYWYDPQSQTQELRGSISLDSPVVGKPFLYDSASFNPLSKAEYRIYAYTIDPDTKKAGNSIDTIADIITVRNVPSKQLNAAASYAPFFLKKKLTDQEKNALKVAAFITGIALLSALSYKLYKTRPRFLTDEEKNITCRYDPDHPLYTSEGAEVNGGRDIIRSPDVPQFKDFLLLREIAQKERYLKEGSGASKTSLERSKKNRDAMLKAATTLYYTSAPKQHPGNRAAQKRVLSQQHTLLSNLAQDGYHQGMPEYDELFAVYQQGYDAMYTDLSAQAKSKYDPEELRYINF